MPDNGGAILDQYKILIEGGVAYDPAATLSVFPMMITFIGNIVFFLSDDIALLGVTVCVLNKQENFKKSYIKGRAVKYTTFGFKFNQFPEKWD